MLNKNWMIYYLGGREVRKMIQDRLKLRRVASGALQEYTYKQ